MRREEKTRVMYIRAVFFASSAFSLDGYMIGTMGQRVERWVCGRKICPHLSHQRDDTAALPRAPLERQRPSISSSHSSLSLSPFRCLYRSASRTTCLYPLMFALDPSRRSPFLRAQTSSSSSLQAAPPSRSPIASAGDSFRPRACI